MPLPPIPTQAADKVNISRQPKADLKKRPKRIEVEEVEEVTELAEGSASFEVETDNSQSLADIAIEKMRAPSKSSKKSSANVVKSTSRVRKIPDDGIIRMFVLDTNVLVAGLRSRNGASFKLLSQLDKGAYELFLTVPLVMEYEDVLLREGMVPLARQDVDAFLDMVCHVATAQEIHFLWRPQLRDPKDELVLEGVWETDVAQSYVHLEVPEVA